MDCFPRTPFEVSDETGINMVVDGVSNYMVVLLFSKVLHPGQAKCPSLQIRWLVHPGSVA